VKKEWSRAGYLSNGVVNLSPRDCFTLCSKGAIIVDVREVYLNSFKMFRVDKIIYIPYSTIGQHFTELPKDKPLIFADSVGIKSRESVLFMETHGYDNVANMAGGIVDWERDGLPIETDVTARLSGSCICQLKPRESKRKI
jgi:rhodanese-related sulfurtransferase